MSYLSNFFSGKLLPVACLLAGGLLDEVAARIGFPPFLCIAVFTLVAVSAATGSERFQTNVFRYAWTFLSLAAALNIGSHIQYGWLFSSALLAISAMKIYTSKDEAIVRTVCAALCAILIVPLAISGLSGGKDNTDAVIQADNGRQVAETFSDTANIAPPTTVQNDPSTTNRSDTCTYCGGTNICDHCIDGACDHCDGEGSTWCKYCSGTGDCSSCYGLGGQDHYVVGKGKVWIQCNLCRGSGICKRCVGGQVKCTSCNGSGQCIYCKGTGECRYCHGL